MWADSRTCFALLLCYCAVNAQVHTHDYWANYESGAMGQYPQVTYASSRMSHPQIHVAKWNESCDQYGYVLMSPHGKRIADNKLMLLDHQGNLVWYTQETGAIHNIQVQRYNGDDYITYWVGDDEFYGHGAGFFKMLDQTYTLTHTISAVNGLDGDYHEFSITPYNTALITSYVKTGWNLTSYGRENGFIWDCVFQEVDVETNYLLFEWRASDHYKFKDMSVDSWTSWTGTSDDPWDWFHLNSVEKDTDGNYLIAARYTNAISSINGTSGKVIWQLGGTRNNFLDLSYGGATKFVDPHMARWDNHHHTAVTVFDNLDFRTQATAEPRSRGAKIALDFKERTANLTIDFQHPGSLFGQSEGSLMKLSNGNYFIGYGSTPVYSEYSPEGRHLCDTNFAPMHSKDGKLEANGVAETYRIYKHSWIGFPQQNPVVKHTQRSLIVHWNGATEVRSWEVEGRGAFGKSASSYTTLGRYSHEDFETEIPLPQTADYIFFRLTALDESGEALGIWKLDRHGSVQEVLYDVPSSQNLLGFSSYVLVVIVGMMYAILRKRIAGSRITLRDSKFAAV